MAVCKLGPLRLSFLMHLEEVGGLVEVVLPLGAALGLDLAELREGPFEQADDALAIDADIRKGVDVVAESEGHGEGGVGLGVVGVDAAFVFSDAERKEVGLAGGGAVEAPGGISQRLNQLFFENADGLEVAKQTVGAALGGSEDNRVGLNRLRRRYVYTNILTTPMSRE